MIRIAIVEDCESDYKVLESYIRQYGEENHVLTEVVHFSNGLNFLDEYTPDFNIVFMDVEMPHIDGIETARKLREKDDTVVLVFVTNMIQYAINGYEVNAIDFMVKPVRYYNFSKKLEKAIVLSERDNSRQLIVHKDDCSVVVPLKSIYYMEKDKNYVLIHSDKGEFKERLTISELEEQLKSPEFFKCNAGCLVNMMYITEVRNDTLLVHGEVLPLARRQKKDFMLRFAQYFGGTI